MKISMRLFLSISFLAAFAFACTSAESDAGGSTLLKPADGRLRIPIAGVNDGKAHHYQVKADDGTMVNFFVLKSRDGVIRAAIDACDVCYKAGKGYYQEGDFMVCENCGQRFVSNRINVVKGGCNPAPLDRTVQGDDLLIAMADVNANKWYMKYRQ
ncbi:MAG: DUF2318 domain-containing protein [Desulfurivibrionaceae bacterium]|nr:DUF2318 domain-containing protein [Desulfobulbales bacterium]MDT8335132.1 DUF2318 domain-containing protein [Desulfurivibrionaceae bacterium]